MSLNRTTISQDYTLDKTLDNLTTFSAVLDKTRNSIRSDCSSDKDSKLSLLNAFSLGFSDSVYKVGVKQDVKCIIS